MAMPTNKAVATALTKASVCSRSNTPHPAQTGNAEPKNAKRDREPLQHEQRTGEGHEFGDVHSTPHDAGP